MKIISIEANTFEEMMERFEFFTRKVENLCSRHKDKSLQNWLDNEEVCHMLNISKRSLQSYRDNGTIAYTQVNHKIYYKPEDIKQVMDLVSKKEEEKIRRSN